MYKKLFYKKVLAAVLLSLLAFIAKAQSPLEQLRAKQIHAMFKFRFTDGNQGYNKILASDANGNAFWRDPLKDSIAIEDFFYVQHMPGIPDSLKLVKDLPRKFWATPSSGTDSARGSYRFITLADLPPGIAGSASGLDSLYVTADSLYQVYVYASGRRDTIQYFGNGGSSDLWTLQGRNVYRPYGYVGINTPSPTARLTLKSKIDWNQTPQDSSGVVLDNDVDTTHAKTYSSLPFVFNTKNYTTFRSQVYNASIRIRSQGVSFNGYSGPGLVLETKNDSTGTYQTIATIGSDGRYTVGASELQGGVLTTNLVLTGQVSTNQNTVKQVESIASNVYDNTNSTALQINGFQRGFIIPRLTTAQRNLIEMVITSITVNNGGSNYSIAPIVSGNGGVVFNQPTLTPVLSGGVITSITVANGGRFYGTPPIGFTVALGQTGSGAVATATTVQDITPGTKIFCTDCIANNGVTGVEQVYAGGQWNNTY